MSLQSVSRSKVFWGAKCASAVTIEKDEANLSHMVDLRHSKINVKKIVLRIGAIVFISSDLKNSPFDQNWSISKRISISATRLFSFIFQTVVKGETKMCQMRESSLDVHFRWNVDIKRVYHFADMYICPMSPKQFTHFSTQLPSSTYSFSISHIWEHELYILESYWQ